MGTSGEGRGTAIDRWKTGRSGGAPRTSAPTTSAPTTSGPTTTPAPATALPTAACAASQLKLAYVGTQGATGHFELSLSLRNLSGRACALRGYPEARLLDAAGQALPMRIKRGGGFFPDTQSRPQRVVLRSGSAAHSWKYSTTCA